MSHECDVSQISILSEIFFVWVDLWKRKKMTQFPALKNDLILRAARGK